MAVQIGPKIGIEGEKAYRDSINKIIQQAKTLKSEMGALTASFDKDKASMQQNKQQRELLNQQITVQKQRVSELNGMLQKSAAEYGENDTKTLKWKQAVADATAELNRMEQELKDLPNSLQLAGNKMQEVGSKFSSIGSSLTSTGRTLTTRVTTPIVGAGATVLKFGSEFDAQMSSVQAVSGAVGDDFDAMREAAISWGEKTVYTAKETGDALYYMGLAGWSPEESIAALGGVLNLAAAGNLDLGRTSDIVTDSMTALQISADGYTNGIRNADHFSNVLAATMSNSNTTVDMMGETFKYAAPVAGTLGYSIEDLSLATGLMANNGIKASMAGTTLRNIFQRMAKPTKESEAAMQKLGLTLDDGEGNMLSFLEVMDQLRSGFGGVMVPEEEFQERLEELDIALENGTLTQNEYDKTLQSLLEDTYGAEGAQQAMYAAMLGGARGMAGVLAIANATDEEYEALKQAIYGADEAFEGQGAAAGMASVQMDNLKGDVTRMTSALGTSMIKISDLSSGPLREFVQGITELINKFNALSPEQQGQIVKWALIAAAIGPVTMAVGGLFSGIDLILSVGGKLVSGIGTIKGLLTGAGGLSAALSGGAAAFGGLAAAAAPFLIGGAVVAGIVAAGVLIYKNWDTIKEKAGQLKDWVGEKWNALKDKTSEVWGNIKENTAQRWNDMKTTVSTKATEMKTAATQKFTELKTAASERMTSLKNTLSTSWDNIKTKASNGLSSMLTTAKNKLANIKNAYTTHGGGVKGIIAAGFTAYKEKYSLGFSALNKLTDGKLGEIGNLFKNKFSDLASKAWTWGSDMLSNFKSGVESKISSLRDAVSWAADTVSSYLHFSEPDKGPLSDFNSSMPDMMHQMAKGITENQPLVEHAVAQVAEGIKSQFTGQLDGVRQAVTDGIEQIAYDAKNWGTVLMQEMAAGIRNGSGYVSQAFLGVNDTMMFDTNTMAGGNARTMNMGGVTIVVNGAGQDADTIANLVMRKLNDQVAQQEAVFGYG